MLFVLIQVYPHIFDTVVIDNVTSRLLLLLSFLEIHGHQCGGGERRYLHCS